MKKLRKSPQGKEALTRVTFEVSPQLVEEFRAIAKSRDRSLSAELRRLMKREVEEDKQHV